jgi:hypothetical protein
MLAQFPARSEEKIREMKNVHSRLLSAALMIQLILAISLCPAQSDAPRVFLLDPTVIMRVKQACQENNFADLRPALEKLRRDADKLLQSEPGSVMDKDEVPPSGDKHDYMSLARYYWPDPKKPDGLPYISRDGEVNPEINSIKDYGNFGRATSSIHTLALAYFLTGKTSYAEHAAKFLRTWFLDSATRMNPNFNFAQAVKGRNEGGPSGLIEARGLANVVDGVGFLAGYPGWQCQDEGGLVQWFDEYLNWLLTSVNGTKEAAATNNHGVWYDVQAGAIALFVGRNDLAKEMMMKAKTKRIDKQIEPDGQQPRELARTTSQNYTQFNLEAFFRLAALAKSTGVNLWNYQTEDGRSIRKALDWVLPFIRGEKEWTHKQIKPFHSSSYYPLLIEASVVYCESSYAELAWKLKGDQGLSDRVHLFLGK